MAFVTSVSFARVVCPLYKGIAIADRTAMMATTTSNSINVNPSGFAFCFVWLPMTHTLHHMVWEYLSEAGDDRDLSRPGHPFPRGAYLLGTKAVPMVPPVQSQ